MDAEKPFGQRIKDSRMAIGLTQAELARRVGCATITIRKIESDALRPSVQIGERLAMALDVPLEARADFIRQSRTATAETAEPPTPTPPPTAEEIGREDLSGRAIRGYELAERIGEGGFGAVYRATHPSLPREVAVKIILPKFANDPDLIRRFEAEAELVARLEHPFIVRLYDYWREPNTACLVMQLMRGGSLKDLLAAGPLPIEKALPVFEQICLALRAAHRFGVIHRDLKPANVLLDEDGNGYLADFGIAKNLGDPEMVDHTHTGALIGSFAYVSPEQIRSESILPQADIYSLGVLLFQLLTGVLPFKGPTPIDYIQQHLNAPLPSCLDEVPGLPPGVDAVIQRATAKAVADRYPDVLAMLADFRAVLTARKPTEFRADFAEIDPAEIENPFKGLRPFGEADADDFYGRDSLVQELLGKLGEESDLARFQAVVGPSGSGKSSVVKAGLVPALRRGGLPGSEKWFIVDFLPGSHPFEELEAALLRVAVNPPDSLLEQLQSGERGLLRAVRRVLPADEDVQLVLVIDQFEELFTLVADDAVRRAFLDSLVATVMDPRGRTRIVVTLRADFVDRPLAYVDFGELMRERTTFILPLAPDELEEAVEAPARRAGLVPEPGLSARIVRELGDQPGTLPLLQHTLSELFERREGRRLTLAAYREIGGVLGSLGRTADDVYAKLTAEGQRLARQLFLRLVTLGEGVEDTRRRVLQAEVEGLAIEYGGEKAEDGGHGTGSSVFRQVVDAFGRARLLTFDRDPVTRGPTVEVAHEALLREWPRLRGWLEQSRADVRLQRVLGQAAAEWLAAGRDAGYLFRGARLGQFAAWAESTDLALTGEELAFLEACLAARREREAEDAARAARERRLEERSRNFLRALVGVFAVAAVVAVVLSMFAFNQQGIAVAAAEARGTAQAIAEEQAELAATNAALAIEQQGIAEEQRGQAEAQRAIAEEEEYNARVQAAIGLASQAILEIQGDSPERAVPLALEALEEYPYTWQAERALSIAVLNSRLQLNLPLGGTILHAQLSRDGGRLLVTSNDLVLTIFDTSTGEIILEINKDKPFMASWSPDESSILVLTDWVEDSEPLSRRNEALAGDPDWEAASEGPSGSYHLQVWNEDGSLRFETAVCDWWATLGNWYPWSPTGDRFVIAGCNGTTDIWDAQTGEIVLTLTGHLPGFMNAAWSPTGERIITTSSGDNQAIIWDADTGERLFTLPGTSNGVLFGDWSPSGRYVAIRGLGGFVYDAFSGEITLELVRPDTMVTRIRWSPDENHIITTSLTDGAARLWDAATGQELSVLSGLTQAWGIAWSPDGRFAAIGGTDGSVRIWNPFQDEEIVEMRGITSDPYLVFWSPDNRIFANDLSSIAIFNTTSATLSIQGLFGAGSVGAWSPDGRYIARGYQDGNIRIFDSTSGAEVLVLPSGEGAAFSIKWSPSGSRIATLNENGEMKIWDASSGQMLIETNAVYATAMTVAWSPDETMLATTSFWSGTVYLWDAQTGDLIASHQLHGNMAGLIEWSPAGDKVASTSPNGSAYIWDPLTGDIFLSLYPDDFNYWVTGLAWSHDGTRLAISSEDNFGRIFNTNTGEEIMKFCCQEAAVWQVSWTPDDNRFVTGSMDGTVKVWDASTGTEVAMYEVGSAASGAFSPDGTRILIAATDGTLRVYPHWQTTEALIAHARECCLIRELTPEEREQFGLPSLEELEGEDGSGFTPPGAEFTLLVAAGITSGMFTLGGLRRNRSRSGLKK